jgi:hypothetical protein
MYSYRVATKVGEVFSLLDIFLEYDESHHVHWLKRDVDHRVGARSMIFKTTSPRSYVLCGVLKPSHGKEGPC